MKRYDNLFLERERIVKNGYLRKTDIAVFMGCGSVKANKLYNSIKKEMDDENKLIDDFGILATRFLKFIGMSEKKVFEDAERERKSNSA